MHITDQQLSAYLDGELSDEQLRQVEQALAEHSELTQRLQVLAQVDHTIKQTYSDIDQTAMPQAVLDMLAASPAKPKTSAIAALWQDFVQQLNPWLPAAGMAAALAVGLLIGSQSDFFNNTTPSTDTAMAASIIKPGDALFAVLESTPAAVTTHIDEYAQVTPVLTFQTGADVFCREFHTTEKSGDMHAVACRENGNWHLQAASYTGPTSSAGSYYLTAAGEDSVVISNFVDQHIHGDAFGTVREQAIINNGWNQ